MERSGNYKGKLCFLFEHVFPSCFAPITLFLRYGVCRNRCFVGLGVPTSLFSQCPDFPVFHHQNKGKCCPLFYYVFFENCFALIACFFTVMGFVQSFICLFGGSNKLVLAISLNSLV